MKKSIALILIATAALAHGAAFARDYQPSTGRYVQADPIGLQGGLNPYAYSNADPLLESDPEGLNPAAAYRAGMFGYRLGEAINPYAQPLISRTLDKAFLPDYNDPNIVLAQNNKQVRRRVKGLEDQVSEHNKKLDQEPNCPASNHWREEIKVWQTEIDRLRLRLPNGK
ncbi:hypothetical protein BH11PSE7_BH11PSE7_36860 [soil metagenome]